LSFSQQRLWFLEQLEGKLTAYNMPTAFLLKGALDVEALRLAFQSLVARHEVVRTSYAMNGGEPLQHIREPKSFKLPLLDLSSYREKEREIEITRLRALEAEQPFDLERDLMLRAQLLRLSEDEHVLLLTQHHIANDGWSGGILRRELEIFYREFYRSDEPDLPALTIQYADYAVWQRRELTGERLAKLLDYWRGRLAGLSPLEVPTDHPRPAIPSYRGARCQFEIPNDLTDRLKDLGRKEGATLQMTLLAAFQILLSRYSGKDDIVVGVPIAGRNHTELEDLIGFFVNTLVQRTDLSGNPTFRDVLGRLREVSLGAYDHQDLPFERLVQELRPERDPGRSPLFQVLFQLLNFSENDLRLEGLEVSRLPATNERVRFDLEMHLWQQPGLLSGVIIYSTDLFEESRIERMVGHFHTLLESIAGDPGKRLGELPMLTADERHQLLVEWNDTAAEYPAKCVHELFEEQAKISPDAMAVVFENERLSYRELNERANRLAHHLRRQGVGTETRVGLWLDRSLELAVGILGILKSGAAYVPLDSEFPASRLKFILEDAKVEYLFTQTSFREVIESEKINLICVDAKDPELDKIESTNPDLKAEVDSLAYVLFTSGSTGQPKGVAMPHRALSNLIEWHRRHSRLGQASRTLQFASATFDVSFQEMFSTWIGGGTLVLVDKETRRNPVALLRYIADEQVERIFVPYVALQQLAIEFAGAKEGLRLRDIVSAGEALHLAPEIQHLLESGDDCFLHNHYGPTETHVVTSRMIDCDVGNWSGECPIGKPIANTKVYLLDAEESPVPIGVSGELYLGGTSLALGYLNRPDLTAEKFVANPFDDDPGSRLYRTGDLCRWRADGNLEFLGRKDDQVKLRGFRIELGEVESVLNNHPGVLQSVAVLREDQPGDKRLVAYFVPAPDVVLEKGELRSHVRNELPDYMVPSAIVQLDKFPLTISGKVARRALPVPEGSRPYLGEDYVGARTKVEEKLTVVWRELLGIDRIGIHDDFFELGGHSLLVARLVGLANEKLDSHLMIGEVYRSPTVAGMAELLNQSQGRDEKGTATNVGHFLTLLQKGSGGGTVILVGGLLTERIKDLPESIMILHLAIDGLGRNAYRGLIVQEAVKAYAEELETMEQVGPIVIVGHSYGGLLAYALAHVLRDQSDHNFELILLEPTWCGSHEARRRMLLKKFHFAVCRGPKALAKSLMFRVRHRLRAAGTEEEKEQLGMDRSLLAGEQLVGDHLSQFFEKIVMENAREYWPPGRLKGRVHLVFGEKWGKLRLPFLAGDYLESLPILITLGEVDHLEVVSKDSAAMRWVELVRDLMSPGSGGDDQSSIENRTQSDGRS